MEVAGLSFQSCLPSWLSGLTLCTSVFLYDKMGLMMSFLLLIWGLENQRGSWV